MAAKREFCRRQRHGYQGAIGAQQGGPCDGECKPECVWPPGPISKTGRSPEGHYGFDCRPGWSYIDCPSLAFTWLVNPGNCSGEAYGARMTVSSIPGDHSASADAARGTAYSDPQSAQNVVVADLLRGCPDPEVRAGCVRRRRCIRYGFIQWSGAQRAGGKGLPHVRREIAQPKFVG